MNTNAGLGIFFAILSAFFFSLTDLGIKYISQLGFEPMHILLMRSLFGMLPIFLWISLTEEKNYLYTFRPLSHIVRGFLGFMAIFCSIFALRMLPIAEYTTISFLSPMFITILSVPLLKEKVGYHRWLAVIFGFIGVLFIIQPGVSAFNMGYFYALVVAVSLSFLVLITRSMSWTETTWGLLFSYALIMLIVSVPFGIYEWKPMNFLELSIMVLIGLFSGFAQISLVKSIAFAEPSLLSPFKYTSIIWAVLWGVLFWNDYPNAVKFIGITIIIVSGLFISYREMKKPSLKKKYPASQYEYRD